MKATPNKDFKLEEEQIIILGDLKELLNKQVNISASNYHLLFNGNKQDINFKSQITPFQVGSQMREINFPMEFNSGEEKERKLNRALSVPISIKVLVIVMSVFMIIVALIKLLGYVDF